MKERLAYQVINSMPAGVNWLMIRTAREMAPQQKDSREHAREVSTSRKPKLQVASVH